MSESKTFLITTGGTGGHIFPAEALSAQLRAKGHIVVEVLDQRSLRYVTYEKSSDKKVFVLYLTPGNSFLNKVHLSFDLIKAFFKSLYILWSTKPEVVIGFGGYTAFPIMIASVVLRKPLILHEQNAFIGRVSKWFLPFSNYITTCFADLYGLPHRYKNKQIVTGNPIRAQIKSVSQVPYKVFTKAGRIKILIVGGSQGAKGFSTFVPQVLARLPLSIKSRLEITQQVPKDMIDSAQMLYKKHKIKATLKPFFNNMHQEYAKTHLVIGRAGASTVMELCAVGRPVIFIPFPYAMDDHQTYNALNITERGAGWMIRESEDASENLYVLLKKILTHPKVLEKAAQNIHHLAKLDACARLTQILESL